MNVTPNSQQEATAKPATSARPKILDLLAIEEFSIDCLCGVY
jgi:mycofactocin precursor